MLRQAALPDELWRTAIARLPLLRGLSEEEHMGAREAAQAAGRRACEREGVQFLDDTVAIAGLKPARDELPAARHSGLSSPPERMLRIGF